MTDQAENRADVPDSRKPRSPGRRAEDQHIHEERLLALEESLTAKFDQKFTELTKILKEAFPGGDPHGHRIYHERSIRTATDWARIKSSIVEKLMTGAVLSACGFIALALVEYVKAQVSK